MEQWVNVASQAKSYRPAIDVARLVAAALIVCFHTPNGPLKQYTIGGLAFFVLLTFCLQTISESRSGSYSLSKRAARLLVPWVVWSLVYGILKAVRHQPLGMDILHDPSRLLVGPRIHLWYLPFAFLGGIAVHALLRLTQRSSDGARVFLLCAMAIALGWIEPTLRGKLPIPFDQWLYSVPLIPLGVAIGLAQRQTAARLAWQFILVLIVTVLLARHCHAPSYLIAVPALCLCILPRSADLRPLRWLANLSLGIYLAHPATFLLLYKYTPHAPWYVFAALGIVASAIVTAAICAVPRLGALALGNAPRPRQQASAPQVPNAGTAAACITSPS
jgi:peptidoglycan/LPS O-acetylase OafA/YrhL